MVYHADDRILDGQLQLFIRWRRGERPAGQLLTVIVEAALFAAGFHQGRADDPH